MMDRDQERFYQEDEQRDIRPQSVVEDEANEEVNDMRYFLQLLKVLREGLNDGTSVPLTGKRLVDVDKLLLVLDDLENNLPDAVQYGMQMYSQKDTFMSKAKEQAMDHITSAEIRVSKALERARNDAEQRVRDAENEAREILDDARERADHMLDESEILRQAREEARAIKNDAKVEASEVRLKARQEAYQLMASVEEQLTEACKSIRRRRAELDDEGE